LAPLSLVETKLDEWLRELSEVFWFYRSGFIAKNFCGATFLSGSSLFLKEIKKQTIINIFKVANDALAATSVGKLSQVKYRTVSY